MRVILSLFLTLLLHYSFAQTVVSDPEENVNYYDVSGSVFLLKDWKSGIVRFNSGRSTDQFKLKFDCLQNKLLLQFNGTAFSTESKVKEFIIRTGKQDSMLFRNGFPANNKETESTYYQVLLEANSILLCLHQKEVVNEGQLVAKTIYRRINDAQKYVLYFKGQMIELKGDKTTVFDSFPGHKEALQKYISEQGLKFRDATDYIQLLKYFNSLPALE